MSVRTVISADDFPPARESSTRRVKGRLLSMAGSLLLILSVAACSGKSAAPSETTSAAAPKSIQGPAAIITRSTPDVGYMDPALYKSLNVSQTVRTNDTVYFSGIVAATGEGDVVAKGDAAGQIRFILQTLDRLLAEEGMSFANLVSTTVYAADIDAVSAQLAIFAEAFAGHPPAMTLIEIKRLASPDYLLELVAVAAL